jgi:mRNA-degrading endonuclease HigB of HigAB toxin-antitoxin module
MPVSVNYANKEKEKAKWKEQLRRSCSPHPKKSLRHLTILVTGMQAREDEKYDIIVKEYNKDPQNIKEGLGMTRCDNAKEVSIVADVLRSICRMEFRVSTSYIRQVTHTILHAMRAGMNITVIGYSYGGSVIDRALAHLREQAERDPLVRSYSKDDGKNSGKKLRAYAFGSIYVPTKPHKVFSIRQYMFEDDWPARSCNHYAPVDRKKATTAGIKWLRPPREAADLNYFNRGIHLHKIYPVQIAYPRKDRAFSQMFDKKER